MDDGAGKSLVRCWSLFFRHGSHSPVGPGVPPQAHLRCSKGPRTGVNDGIRLPLAAARNLVPVTSTPPRSFRYFLGGTGDLTPLPIFLSVTVTVFTGLGSLKCAFEIST